MGTKCPISFPGFYVRERGRREREHPSFSLRSSEFHQLEFVEPRVKVHLLDEGYAWVPKRGDFAEDPNEEISGNQGFRVREASYPSYYAPRGRDSSYFSLFMLFVD